MNRGTQIVEIGKKSWLVGLWWQSFEHGKGLKHEGRKLIKSMLEQGADASLESINTIVVRSQHGAAQVGYGSLPDRKTPAIPSLAVALADAKPTNWLALLPLANGFWVVAVTNGNVSPDGDFFGDREGADEAFFRCKDLVEKWDDVFKLETEVDSFRFFEGLLSPRSYARSPKAIAFTPQLPTKQIIKTAVAAGLIGIFWFGISTYVENRAEARRQEQLAATQAAILAQQSAGLAAQDVVWRNLPAPTGFLSLCREEFRAVLMVRYGWNVTQWGCSVSGTQTSWERGPRGGFQLVPEGLSVDPRSPFSGVSNTPLVGAEDLPKVDKDVELVLFAQTLPTLYEIARVAGQVLKVEWPPPPAPPSEETGAVPAPPVLPKILWEMSAFSFFPPEDFGQMLQEIPGLAVERIEWASGAQKWTIKGVLYGKG